MRRCDKAVMFNSILYNILVLLTMALVGVARPLHNLNLNPNHSTTIYFGHRGGGRKHLDAVVKNSERSTTPRMRACSDKTSFRTNRSVLSGVAHGITSHASAYIDSIWTSAITRATQAGHALLCATGLFLDPKGYRRAHFSFV